MDVEKLLGVSGGVILLNPLWPRSRTNIPTMHHSLWLAIVTMTTVGHLAAPPLDLAGRDFRTTHHCEFTA